MEREGGYAQFGEQDTYIGTGQRDYCFFLVSYSNDKKGVLFTGMEICWGLSNRYYRPQESGDLE